MRRAFDKIKYAAGAPVVPEGRGGPVGPRWVFFSLPEAELVKIIQQQNMFLMNVKQLLHQKRQVAQTSNLMIS